MRHLTLFHVATRPDVLFGRLLMTSFILNDIVCSTVDYHSQIRRGTIMVSSCDLAVNLWITVSLCGPGGVQPWATLRAHKVVRS